jgi:hypothetical protein
VSYFAKVNGDAPLGIFNLSRTPKVTAWITRFGSEPQFGVVASQQSYKMSISLDEDVNGLILVNPKSRARLEASSVQIVFVRPSVGTEMGRTAEGMSVEPSPRDPSVMSIFLPDFGIIADGSRKSYVLRDDYPLTGPRAEVDFFCFLLRVQYSFSDSDSPLTLSAILTYQLWPRLMVNGTAALGGSQETEFRQLRAYLFG